MKDIKSYRLETNDEQGGEAGRVQGGGHSDLVARKRIQRSRTLLGMRALLWNSPKFAQINYA